MSNLEPPALPPIDQPIDAPPTTTVDEPHAVVEAVAQPVEMARRRNPNDIYAFGAMLCALLGFIIPIVPAAAALMLVRATEDDLVDEPISPAAQSVANAARTLAYTSITIIVIACTALLLGVLGRVIAL